MYPIGIYFPSTYAEMVFLSGLHSMKMYKQQ